MSETINKMRKEVAALRQRETAAEATQEGLAKDVSRLTGESTALKTSLAAAEANVKRLKAENARLTRELNAGHGTQPADGASLSSSAGVAELQQRIRVLEAQNTALRSAAAEMTVNTGSVPASARTSGAGAASLLGQAAGQGTGADDPGAATRLVQLEAERKARKRMDALAAKLTEKSKEAEAAKASEAAATTALSRIAAERDTLQRRLTEVTKRQAQLDAATSALMADLEPVAQLKARVFDLEESLAQSRQRSEGELPAECAQLRAQLTEARNRVAAAEAEAQELRNALRVSHQRREPSGGVVDGDGESTSTRADLRRSEDHFQVEAALRERLAEARRDVARLEGEVLARDSVVVELRFELDAAKQAEERLRRRVAELSALVAMGGRAVPGTSAEAVAAASSLLRADAGSETGGAVGAAVATTSKHAAKRAAELEELVAALRKVTEKQRGELERLRKSAHAQATTQSPELRAAKAEIAQLETRVKELDERSKATESLRRTLHSTELDLKEARASVARLEKELQSARERISHLERHQAAGQASSSAVEVAAASSRQDSKQAESTTTSTRETIERLERENAALRTELGAFDLE
jgi:DNA repair exonuclease SbcCD ATPase subunit